MGHTGVTEDAAKSEGPTHAPLRPWLLKAVLYLRRSERLRISANDYIADSRIRKRTFRDVPIPDMIPLRLGATPEG